MLKTPAWIIVSRAGRSLRLLSSKPGFLAALIAILYLVAKASTRHTSELLKSAVWKSSTIDLLNWTIGAHGQGVIVVPLVSCILLSMSSIRETPPSVLVAYGSRCLLMASRAVEALVLSLFAASTCFLIWLATALSENNVAINWNDGSSFFFGQTLYLSSIDAVSACALLFVCLATCAAYTSLLFASIETLTESAEISSFCIMSCALIGYFLPWTNETWGFLPDVYTLVSRGFSLGLLAVPAACIVLLICAFARFQKCDFLKRSR